MRINLLSDSSALYKFNTVLIICVWINALIWALMPIFGWGRYVLSLLYVLHMTILVRQMSMTPAKGKGYPGL